MAKKVKTGPYRRLVRVEITQAVGMYKKGDVADMHPTLFKKLQEKKVAVKTAKPLTNAPILPSAKISNKSED